VATAQEFSVNGNEHFGNNPKRLPGLLGSLSWIGHPDEGTQTSHDDRDNKQDGKSDQHVKQVRGYPAPRLAYGEGTTLGTAWEDSTTHPWPHGLYPSPGEMVGVEELGVNWLPLSTILILCH
jgi:hypothetical protein